MTMTTLVPILKSLMMAAVPLLPTLRIRTKSRMMKTKMNQHFLMRKRKNLNRKTAMKPLWQSAERSLCEISLSILHVMICLNYFDSLVASRVYFWSKTAIRIFPKERPLFPFRIKRLSQKPLRLQEGMKSLCRREKPLRIPSRTLVRAQSCPFEAVVFSSMQL